jgi:membrane fusion protein, multidrug efflux system
MIAVVSVLRSAVGASLLAWVLCGCSDGPATPRSDVTNKPQGVGVIAVQPAPLTVIRELPGRIAPTRIAEVRARVSGIVVSRNFEQGSDVAAGDVLYRIDPAPFEIELSAAEAARAKAKAVLEHETQNANRAQALIPHKALSQAQLESAVASRRQAEADVASRDADVARAKLNLDHTVIRAPISGRIGRALVTEGALVGQSDVTHVATVQQLNPIYVDFTQSVAELSRLRREFENGDLEEVGRGSARVSLILDNGEVYPSLGKLLFSDTTVDPGTGQVILRGEFPNPKMTMLPGMYVRVQIEQGIDPDALAVPQQAVRRTDAGESQVFVVRDDNRASIAAVKLGRTIEDRWLILDGLNPGDRVIVDGFQKFVAGDVVDPQPWRGRDPRRSANAESQVTR